MAACPGTTSQGLCLSKKTKFDRDFGLRGQIQDAAGSLKGFKGSRFGANKSSQKKSNPER
jgi:hypothetical protein